MMESMTTWNTLEARNLKKELLGTNQSELYPFTQDLTAKLTATPSPIKPPNVHHPSTIVDSQSARDETRRRRAPQSQDHVPPRLKPSKSSPVLSSEKEKVSVSRMWKSFAAPDDFGDTQPVDTQTFVADSDIATSRIDERTSGHDSHHLRSEGREGHDGSAVVDLVGNVEEPEPEPEVDYDDVSDVSSQADELATVFKVPKTPATNGRKRNACGEIIGSETRTSAIRTPGSALPMAGMFGNIGVNNMSMSQLFKATQAASSPLPNAPKSDPVFDRPSPHLNFRNSSPVAMRLSSPTRPSTADGFTSGRILSDPLDTYVPMNESQEERERRLRREQQVADSLEDDEFEESMPGAQWRQQQKKIQQKALTSAAELTAPDRVRSSGPGRPRKIGRSKSATNIATPSRPRSSGRKDRTSAIHSDATDLFSDVQQAPLPQESSVEDMEIDELAIVSKAQPKSQDALVPETSPHPRSQSRSQRNARHRRSPSRRSASPPKSQNRAPNAAEAPMTTQKTVVVVDSQADRMEMVEERDDVAHPAARIDSSTISSQVRISQTQSQYSSLKPANRVLLSQRILGAIDTSSVPRPPPHSPRLREEDFAPMPSSPPLLPMEGDEDDDESLDELDDDEVDLIGAEAGILQPTSFGQLPHTIAETKVVESGNGADQLQSSRPSHRASQTVDNLKALDAGADEESAPFATANSQLSPAINTRLHATGPDTDTNRPQVGEIRKFGDLTVEAEPQNSIDSADINFNILTEGDEEFHNMMSGSSPVRPKKRQKVYGRSALREPAKMANIPSSDVSQGTVAKKMQPSLKKRADVYDSPESTSLTERAPTPTPQSTKKRELDGATAATRTREAITATKKAPSPNPKSLARTNKITKETHIPKPTSSSSGRPRPRSLKILEVAETPSLSSSASNRATTAQSAGANTKRQLPKSKEGVSKSVEKQADVTEDVIAEEELFPNRVLAMFKGDMNFYTATVLGLVRGDGIKFKVRYDDRNEDILDSTQIRKLDLRVGDRVKVELPKMKTKTYIVVGFCDKITLGSDTRPDTKTAPHALGPLPDVYGHLKVRLQVKGRESLPTPAATSGDVIEADVQYIYLPRTMISNFADRKYLDNSMSFGRLTTPSINTSAPSTPSSRSRRQYGTTTCLPSAVPTITKSGIFANMAFAVTFSESHDKEKEATLDLVQSHGAQIIEVGFDELFDLDPSGAPTPKKSSPRKLHQAASTHPDSLCLTRDAKNLGFTALIADRYCRRAKYVQALALSIPCLHYRWVTDSIAASEVLPFSKYLLPAGESAFLSGAVRSRSLSPYNPISEDANLRNILSRRNLLLGGKSVLVVKGKGKTEEKRKIYLFLTYALGAAEIGLVRDLAEAKAELESRPWDWVYVDGEPEAAKKVLFGKDNGKKRKRESSVATASVGGKDIKVVGDEFVIQSLILGALLED